MSLEQFIQDRVAEIAGIAAPAISVNTALSRLGMDSLGMLRLIESIERDLQTEIPDSVPLDRLTIEGLASALSTGSRRRGFTGASLSGLMIADSELPDDIRPPDASAAPAGARSILLTGATGFLGAFLLRSLLRNTDGEVVCLVRPDGHSARSRIHRNLQRHGIWEDDFENRITLLEADISQPFLGLSPCSFDALAASVDVIFHAAASVNWVQPYSRLRYANVLSVREMLRLACRRRAKPFHLISSLAVCYSTTNRDAISETDDALPDLDGIHFGYAQSKCVAEALTRAAGRRGLPVSIFRAALISGDSLTGSSGLTDIISLLIRACVEMHVAPDLDWRLDLLPVDFAADAIAQLAFLPNPDPVRAVHLANPNQRHWRELILWMNLFGYRVEIVPYEDWLERLYGDVKTRKENPLRDLVQFFAQRPENENGWYLPQLYEEPRRRKVRFDITRELLKNARLKCPRLSAELLDRYFQSFIDRDFLPELGRSTAADDSPPNEVRPLDVEFFRSVISDADVTGARRMPFSGGHSVIGELTSWKYGRSIGVHAYRLEFAAPHRECDVVVKVKARDVEVTTVGQTLAALCGAELGKAYEHFSDCLGLTGCDTRELSVYQRGDGVFRQITPKFFGGKLDGRRVVLVLENLSGLEMMDSIDQVDEWRPEHIEAAIEGISKIHARWYEATDGAAWLRPVRASRIIEAKALWIALAQHATPIFSQWMGADIRSLQNRLIELLAEFHQLGESMPHTVIHNDFNPRNLGFRRIDGQLQLCVYDWELATVALPQHDLAEILCFVLGPEANAASVLRYIEMHRAMLLRFTGRQIDESLWRSGFCLCLCDLMINRFPLYAMIHRFNEQRFLQRVIRTWKAIFDVVSSTVHTPF